MLEIRGVRFDAARPAVVVPLTGGDLDELLAQAAAVREAGPDLVEWRVDLAEALAGDARALVLAGHQLVDALGGLPLLVTVRTEPEGGRAAADPEAHLATLAASGGCRGRGPGRRRAERRPGGRAAGRDDGARRRRGRGRLVPRRRGHPAEGRAPGSAARHGGRGRGPVQDRGDAAGRGGRARAARRHLGRLARARPARHRGLDGPAGRGVPAGRRGVRLGGDVRVGRAAGRRPGSSTWPRSGPRSTRCTGTGRA